MAQITARMVDWQPLRDAFVQRSTRPTQEELATEFNVPLGSIGRCASEEGWTTLRANYLEKRLQEADASSVLLEAVQVDRTIIRAMRDLALVGFEKIKTVMESVDEGAGDTKKQRSPQAKLDAINTASFAAANFCRALKDVGIVGLPKGLSQEGKEGNGRWNPQMLQQINLTVQNQIAQAGASALTKVERVAPSEPIQSVAQQVTEIPADSAPIPTSSDSASKPS